MSECWHMANARLSELVQAGERQCAVAVWQLKHGPRTLRQLSDTCPQQRETGLHGTPQDAIQGHGKQHKRVPKDWQGDNVTQQSAVGNSAAD